MVLVDTSVWVDHLKAADVRLVDLLEQEQVLTHPYVIAEVSLGGLHQREQVVGALLDLPAVPVATPEETLYLIEHQALFSRGIGFVDASLLASARLLPGTRVWTRDKRLQAAVDELGLGAVLCH